MVYSGLQERLNTLLLRASTAFYLHASNPRVKGNDAESLRQWCAAQEVRNLFVEQNPAVAAKLLPTSPSLAAINGMPLVPAGIRYVVDETTPGMVDLSVEVPGVTFVVEAPGIAPFSPTVVDLPTRTSAVFAANFDELYTVKILAAGKRVATILVPVNRALLSALREHNRQGAYQFKNRLPDPQPEYVALLAFWIAANDAAATGQSQLYYDLIAASEKVVPRAPRPTAVYPYRHA